MGLRKLRSSTMTTPPQRCECILPPASCAHFSAYLRDIITPASHRQHSSKMDTCERKSVRFTQGEIVQGMTTDDAVDCDSARSDIMQKARRINNPGLSDILQIIIRRLNFSDEIQRTTVDILPSRKQLYEDVRATFIFCIKLLVVCVILMLAGYAMWVIFRKWSRH